MPKWEEMHNPVEVMINSWFNPCAKLRSQEKEICFKTLDLGIGKRA
jgi:hypothetical protein